MDQQQYSDMERELMAGEQEYEAHNETKPCACPLCERYRRMSSIYQVEQSRRCGHV